MDMLKGSFISLYYMRKSTFIQILDLLASVLIIMVYTILVTYIVIVSINLIRVRKRYTSSIAYFAKKDKRWKFLFEGLNIFKMGGHAIATIKIVTEVVAPLVLIFLVKTPQWVMLGIIILMALQILFVAFAMPYYKKIENFTEILNNFILVLILLILFIFEIKSEEIKDDFKHYYGGYTIIGLLVFTLLVNFLVGIYSMFVEYDEQKDKQYDLATIPNAVKAMNALNKNPDDSASIELKDIDLDAAQLAGFEVLKSRRGAGETLTKENNPKYNEDQVKKKKIKRVNWDIVRNGIRGKIINDYTDAEIFGVFDQEVSDSRHLDPTSDNNFNGESTTAGEGSSMEMSGFGRNPKALIQSRKQNGFLTSLFIS